MPTILVVEDDDRISKALSMRLQHQGFFVLRAPDAVLATSLAKSHKPDVALLDINIPAGNGFLVAERIQQEERVPVIYITASKNPEFRRKALNSGAAGFLEKPFSADQLFDAIDDALAGVYNLNYA